MPKSCAQAIALRDHRFDLPGEIEHRIDHVHAAPGHAAGGAFLALLAPVLAGSGRRSARRSCLRCAAACPGGRRRASRDLLQRGLEAPVVADAERDAVLGAGRAPPARALSCVRPSGFSVNTGLPASAAATICSACMRVRRRQHDRVDRRIGEHLRRSSRACGCRAVAANSRGLGRRARRAGDESDERRSCPARC